MICTRCFGLFPFISARASLIRCYVGSVPRGTGVAEQVAFRRDMLPWHRALWPQEAVTSQGCGTTRSCRLIKKENPSSWQPWPVGAAATQLPLTWPLLSSEPHFAFLPCSPVVCKQLCCCGRAGPKRPNTPTHVLSLCCEEAGSKWNICSFTTLENRELDRWWHWWNCWVTQKVAHG